MLYFYLVLSGFFGGVLRGLVGFIKHQFSYKNVPFNLKYFLGMSFISGVIGLSASLALREVGMTLDGFFTPALSFIIGYAGGDFLESVYKIILDRSSLGQKPTKKK